MGFLKRLKKNALTASLAGSFLVFSGCPDDYTSDIYIPPPIQTPTKNFSVTNAGLRSTIPADKNCDYAERPSEKVVFSDSTDKYVVAYVNFKNAKPQEDEGDFFWYRPGTSEIKTSGSKKFINENGCWHAPAPIPSEIIDRSGNYKVEFRRNGKVERTLEFVVNLTQEKTEDKEIVRAMDDYFSTGNSFLLAKAVSERAAKDSSLDYVFSVKEALANRIKTADDLERLVELDVLNMNIFHIWDSKSKTKQTESSKKQPIVFYINGIGTPRPIALTQLAALKQIVFSINKDLRVGLYHNISFKDTLKPICPLVRETSSCNEKTSKKFANLCGAFGHSIDFSFATLQKIKHMEAVQIKWSLFNYEPLIYQNFSSAIGGLIKNGEKIIFVAHSQGNFFADGFSRYYGEEYGNNYRIISLGTPIQVYHPLGIDKGVKTIQIKGEIMDVLSNVINAPKGNIEQKKPLDSSPLGLHSFECSYLLGEPREALTESIRYFASELTAPPKEDSTNNYISSVKIKEGGLLGGASGCTSLEKPLISDGYISDVNNYDADFLVGPPNEYSLPFCGSGKLIATFPKKGFDTLIFSSWTSKPCFCSYESYWVDFNIYEFDKGKGKLLFNGDIYNYDGQQVPLTKKSDTNEILLEWKNECSCRDSNFSQFTRHNSWHLDAIQAVEKK